MDDAILRKIKRCMDLSSSSNEHEAAMALKQMQAMMKKHNISESNVLAFEVNDSEYKTSTKGKPKAWVWDLHGSIAQALDCKSYLRGRHSDDKARLVFVGIGNTPDIASYAFDVLYRKVLDDRKRYLKHDIGHIQSSKLKTKMADAYCEGWVNSAYKKARNLNPCKETMQKIQAYEETKINLGKSLKLGFVTKNTPDNRIFKAFHDGVNDSDGFDLHVATGHTKQPQIARS